MSHSRATADAYYKNHTEATSLQGYEVMGEIMQVEIPGIPTKKRVKFTELQTDIIKQYFARAIQSGKLPQACVLEQFLAEKLDLFPLRKRGDIYSKLRNIIRRENLK